MYTKCKWNRRFWSSKCKQYAGAFILIQMSQAVQNVFLIFIIGKVAQFSPPPISSLPFSYCRVWKSIKFSLWSQRENSRLDGDLLVLLLISFDFFFISYVRPSSLSPLIHRLQLNLDFHCAFNKFHTFLSLLRGYLSRCWKRKRDFIVMNHYMRIREHDAAVRKCTRHRM